jgi:hypothetical protein
VRDVTLLGPEAYDPDNGSILIRVGPSSLVKNCIVKRSSREGIVVGDGSQVEGCVIGGTQDGDGNLHFGLFGGNRVLVTRNTVIGNGFGPVAARPARHSAPMPSSWAATAPSLTTRSAATARTASTSARAAS